MKYYDIILHKGYKIILKSGFLFNSYIYNFELDENINISVIEHDTGWFELSYSIQGKIVKFECKEYEIEEI